MPVRSKKTGRKISSAVVRKRFVRRFGPKKGYSASTHFKFGVQQTIRSNPKFRQEEIAYLSKTKGKAKKRSAVRAKRYGRLGNGNT